MGSVLAPATLRRLLATFGFTGYTGMPASSRKLISKPWLVQDDARQLLRVQGDAEQKVFQALQALIAMGKTLFPYPMSRLI
jgi:hypothetical protein